MFNSDQKHYLTKVLVVVALTGVLVWVLVAHFRKETPVSNHAALSRVNPTTATRPAPAATTQPDVINVAEYITQIWPKRNAIVASGDANAVLDEALRKLASVEDKDIRDYTKGMVLLLTTAQVRIPEDITALLARPIPAALPNPKIEPRILAAGATLALIKVCNDARAGQPVPWSNNPTFHIALLTYMVEHDPTYPSRLMASLSLIQTSQAMDQDTDPRTLSDAATVFKVVDTCIESLLTAAIETPTLDVRAGIILLTATGGENQTMYGWLFLKVMTQEQVADTMLEETFGRIQKILDAVMQQPQMQGMEQILEKRLLWRRDFAAYPQKKLAYVLAGLPHFRLAKATYQDYIAAMNRGDINAIAKYRGTTDLERTAKYYTLGKIFGEKVMRVDIVDIKYRKVNIIPDIGPKVCMMVVARLVKSDGSTLSQVYEMNLTHTVNGYIVD